MFMKYMHSSWHLTNCVKADVVKTQTPRFIYSQFFKEPLKMYYFKKRFLASAQRHWSHKMCSILVLVGKEDADKYDKVKL